VTWEEKKNTQTSMNTYYNLPGMSITSSSLGQCEDWPAFLLKLLVVDDTQLQSQQVAGILGKGESLWYTVL